jgi:hypothetical protein
MQLSYMHQNVTGRQNNETVTDRERFHSVGSGLVGLIRTLIRPGFRK